MTNSKLGAYFRTRRLARGLSLERMCGQLGYNVSTVSRWERGENYPNLTQLMDWMQVLGLELTWRDA